MEGTYSSKKNEKHYILSTMLEGCTSAPTMPPDKEAAKLLCELQYDVKRMLNNPMYSDVKIIIDDTVFQCQKFILSRNSIFNMMFILKPTLNKICLFSHESNPWTNAALIRNSDQYGFIYQIPSKASETFLLYLYGHAIEKEKVNPNLLLVANRFADKVLQNFCENQLSNNLNLENVIQTLLISVKIKCDILKIQACKFIAKNFWKVKFKKDFHLVLENYLVLTVILDLFAENHTTLITKATYRVGSFENLLNESIECLRNADLLLTVDNHHFLAHKNILSERNAVFKEMINASIDGTPITINIPNVEPDIVEQFLLYLYTGKVRYFGKSIFLVSLLKLACDYADDWLIDKCEKEFLRNMNDKNVIDLLITANNYNCKHLMMVTANYIVVRYDKIMALDSNRMKLLKNAEAAIIIMNKLYEKSKPHSSRDFFNGRLILDVRRLKNSVGSKVFKAKSGRWIIVLKKSVDNSYLDILLCCVNWTPAVFSHIRFVLKLISSTDEQNNITEELNINNNEYTFFWGWKKFITWSKLKKSKLGYIKNGRITLEIDATAV